ncbi:MjaII restriction endonuclease superfamily protein [Crenothrix polyspora]|uniref:MjaII restriction endonuclease superfamily protein n=1 Tax=Crenothrix polyspora TaxID=360316 RepID=A0A1R4H1M9_9GAMM|nr:PmeII family type II restriction endonuclease [Crenothrix polyspora]SJM89950.1 MjaII restriction endonuclease superfamily protein [Crenothrix polyspora]
MVIKIIPDVDMRTKIMTENEKTQILRNAQQWFKNSIASQHIINAKKLTNPAEFNINPFLTIYLANFLTGNSNPESIAKALIYPRILGTSITTSFGTHIQRFTGEVLSSFGSTTHGIDIEFIDQIDGFKKYCQLKSGPNTINKDDVETIAGHFSSIINLSRTNNLRVTHSDLCVGIIYGEERDLSSHYKRITSQYHYSVIIGQDFWYRLTGDEHFYHDLIKSIGEVAIEANFTQELDTVIAELASKPEIIELSC